MRKKHGAKRESAKVEHSQTNHLFSEKKRSIKQIINATLLFCQF